MNQVEEKHFMQMVQMIFGFWLSRTVYVAAKLGLADAVGDEPRTVEELAERTGTHAPTLRRIMRALASAGIFAEDEEGRFASTPLAATLRTGIPGSLRSFAISELGDCHFKAWEDVLHSVRTGEIAFDHVFGASVWDYYACHADEAAVFNESMSNLTSVVEAAVLDSYNFGRFGKIVDVGGGHGGFMTAILKKHEETKGIVYDAPHVVEGARRRIQEAALGKRCEVTGGDFFASVPGGGDAYVMKWIIHDWDDERSLRILRNCHRAMKKGGRLLLIEAVVPDGNEPSPSKFMDLNMLVMTGGRERSAAEFRALLAEAGFELTSVMPTNSPMSVVESVRVEH